MSSHISPDQHFFQLDLSGAHLLDSDARVDLVGLPKQATVYGGILDSEQVWSVTVTQLIGLMISIPQNIDKAVPQNTVTLTVTDPFGQIVSELPTELLRITDDQEILIDDEAILDAVLSISDVVAKRGD